MPRAFIAQSGLNVGGAPTATAWTLSPRELHMLMTIIQQDREREVLSRPMVCVRDGQTALVQVSHGQGPIIPAGGMRPPIQFIPTGLVVELTPNVVAGENRVRLVANCRLTEEKGTVNTSHALRATTALRFGETLVLTSGSGSTRDSFCGMLKHLCERDSFVTLILVTPELAGRKSSKPADGWFVK